MDLVELLFRAVGAFYLFAGHLGARAMVLGAVADKMIATLSGAPAPRGMVDKHALLGAGVVVTAAGGAALLLMSFWALPLFVAGLAVQVGWLWRTRRGFSPRDEEEERGWLRTAYAATIYAAATLGVLWLWKQGRLGEPDEPLPIGLVMTTAIYFTAWMTRDLRWRPRPGRMFDDPDLPREPRQKPVRVRLDPRFGSWPLVDVDRNHRFNHLTWLPENLAFRIEDWDDTFQLACNPDEPTPQPDFGTAERAVAYVEEGRAIVLALCDHFGADKVQVSATFGRGPDAA